MSETIKDQQYMAAGVGTLIGFTATDQYDDEIAARYWFDGDRNKVINALAGKQNPFVVLAIGIVQAPLGVQYAMARHLEDCEVALSSVGRIKVNLYRGKDTRYWFCKCKPGAESLGASEDSGG